MQTYINPFEQNNDHTRLMHKIQFCSSFNVTYRPPNENTKIIEEYCEDLFSKNSKNLKDMILKGDFKINALDYEQNKKVKRFLHLIYQYNMISVQILIL